MKTLNMKVRRGGQGLGLSLIYRGRDRFEKDQTGLYISQLVPGGAAMRAGLKKEDRIVMINKKSPKTMEEAIGILKRAKTFIELVVERQEKREYHARGLDEGQLREQQSQEEEEEEERASDLSSKRMSIREFEDEEELEETYKRERDIYSVVRKHLSASNLVESLKSDEEEQGSGRSKGRFQ